MSIGNGFILNWARTGCKGFKMDRTPEGACLEMLAADPGSCCQRSQLGLQEGISHLLQGQVRPGSSREISRADC